MGKIVLKLSVPERDCIVSNILAQPDLTERLKIAANDKNQVAAAYSVDEIEDLLDAITAEANYAADEQLQKNLDRVADKLEEILLELERF